MRARGRFSPLDENMRPIGLPPTQFRNWASQVEDLFKLCGCPKRAVRLVRQEWCVGPFEGGAEPYAQHDIMNRPCPWPKDATVAVPGAWQIDINRPTLLAEKGALEQDDDRNDRVQQRLQRVRRQSASQTADGGEPPSRD